MSKGKLLAVCFVWLLLLGAGVLIWKLVFQKDRPPEAGSPSRYRRVIDFHLDSFSGYALLRSDDFSNQLKQRGIRIDLHDDGADYGARILALHTGEAQMAVFTIDALIKASADLGEELPATIVALVDETTGADAIVAYKSQVPNIDALNTAETRFVLTPSSPSETLARVVMSRFHLDNLSKNPFLTVSDAGEVFQRYQQAKPTEPLAFVLWEPYVSQILKNPRTHVVVDSSRFPATIVDVIVANGDFLLKNRDAVKDVVECYLRTAYRYRDRNEMLNLVAQDAKRSGSPLSDEEAGKLVDGIWWKNTQENLAHTGLLAGKSLPHLEDMIANITEVLLSTGAIEADPTQGHPNYLYYREIFESLQNFHPGDEAEQVRDLKLPALNDQQWEQLEQVGQARVSDLVFARGTDRLTERSRRILDDLVGKLTTTRFYVQIRGNASQRGDLEQNTLLAERRAKAAEQYLVGQGVEQSRIRAVGGEPSGKTSVTFVLGQPPY